MDFNSLWMSAILGAAGGMIGVRLARRLENPLLRALLMISPVALSLALGLWLSPRNGPFEQMVNEAAEEFRDNKSFANAIRGMDESEAHTFTEEKARAGLRRLSFEQLRDWNELRLKMAAENPEVCAGLWTGRGLDGDKIRNALLKMQPQDGRRWIRISMAAAILEIEQKAAPEPVSGAISIGIAKANETLSPEDRQRFSAILISSTNAEDSDACWAMMILLKVSAELGPDDQEKFLRGLAAI